MVIIKWFRGIYSITSLVLDHWQRKIRALHEAFIDISIQHISRNFNAMADVLSKRALSLDPGLMQVEEVVDGQVVSSYSHFFF